MHAKVFNQFVQDIGHPDLQIEEEFLLEKIAEAKEDRGSGNGRRILLGAGGTAIAFGGLGYGIGRKLPKIVKYGIPALPDTQIETFIDRLARKDSALAKTIGEKIRVEGEQQIDMPLLRRHHAIVGAMQSDEQIRTHMEGALRDGNLNRPPDWLGDADITDDQVKRLREIDFDKGSDRLEKGYETAENLPKFRRDIVVNGALKGGFLGAGGGVLRNMYLRHRKNQEDRDRKEKERFESWRR